MSEDIDLAYPPVCSHLRQREFCPDPGCKKPPAPIVVRPVKRRPLVIFVPPELEGQRADIQRFFDAMIYKLRKNAHKGHWPDADLKTILGKLREEVTELAGAIKEGSSSEILMEGADVANFALIAANIALEAKGV